MQSVHDALPSISLNLPAMQDLHGPPSGPVYPALQRQIFLGGLCVYEFAGQASHSADPVSALKNPGSHGVQGEPVSPSTHTSSGTSIISDVAVRFVPNIASGLKTTALTTLPSCDCALGRSTPIATEIELEALQPAGLQARTRALYWMEAFLASPSMVTTGC